MKKCSSERGLVRPSSFASFACAGAFAGALLALSGCGTAAATEPPPAFAATTTTAGDGAGDAAPRAPHAELSVAVRAKDDGAGDDPRGVLLVHEDVLAHCSSLQPTAASAGAGKNVGKAGKMAWLGVMRSLATCMKDGSLKDRDLVLHGPSRPQVVVKYIFAKLGVPESRVQMSPPDGASCATDEECTAAERRVEIGLTGANPEAVGAL